MNQCGSEAVDLTVPEQSYTTLTRGTGADAAADDKVETDVEENDTQTTEGMNDMDAPRQRKRERDRRHLGDYLGTDSGPNPVFMSNTARIGSKYMKAIYREYTDATFTMLKPVPPEDAHKGLIGPVLRAEVGDTIEVIFKNNLDIKASVHPHGVFYPKNAEGATYVDGSKNYDKLDDKIDPGAVYTYLWTVPERAGTVLFFRQKFTLEDAIGSHACSLEANMRVTNGIPLGSSLLLPVCTVNCAQTLKVQPNPQPPRQSGFIIRMSTKWLTFMLD
jgi:hypothetical protein